MNGGKADKLDIDWDEVAEILNDKPSAELPDNGITTQRIAERMNISLSSARRRYIVLKNTGKYDELRAEGARGQLNFLVKK